MGRALPRKAMEACRDPVFLSEGRQIRAIHKFGVQWGLFSKITSPVLLYRRPPNYTDNIWAILGSLALSGKQNRFCSAEQEVATPTIKSAMFSQECVQTEIINCDSVFLSTGLSLFHVLAIAPSLFRIPWLALPAILSILSLPTWLWHHHMTRNSLWVRGKG